MEDFEKKIRDSKECIEESNASNSKNIYKMAKSNSPMGKSIKKAFTHKLVIKYAIFVLAFLLMFTGGFFLSKALNKGSIEVREKIIYRSTVDNNNITINYDDIGETTTPLSFSSFNSQEELVSYLADNRGAKSTANGDESAGWYSLPTAQSEAASSSPKDSNGSSYQTNTQVENVDEADIVKVKGNHIFYIASGINSNSATCYMYTEEDDELKLSKEIEFSEQIDLIDTKDNYELVQITRMTPADLYVTDKYLVLRINKYEDSFEVTVGNIFHHILSKCYEDDFDFDMLWNNEVDNSSYEFNNMEKYFLGSLHDRLESIINVIKKQLKYTSLNNIVCEKRFLIDVDKDLHITFKGFVDKIMYDEVNGESVVVVIDYKTGNASLDLNKIIYGLGMQLPVYVYLIKNSNEFNNVRIGGFYLQNILNNSEEELEDNLKLQGYTNSDLVSIIDSSYENSKLIKSMKTSNNGFYQYSKIINDEGIDKISNIIKDKINDAGKKIINNEFDINPKQIKDDLIGCRYCKYKDICYMKNEDIVKLDVPGNILGGEIND